ncbi:MAG TPA: diaminopimelate decarboxylase [Persephonella sp.]|uniref:Diaminopimelate decarboxylase n=1 Tax=Persephonella marina (strain DSM 14350 / EX-H1) TaxID=123214 RepID=C0QPS5_PERMH|nr:MULTISPECIES: alanine racemase [Persephonella]ACO04279.1 diaminopimelate decarboxylase [Persephonella marina EX-H1]HCB69714.1 diaminopimelate decarboxylase [Persephonella sp.]
MKKVYEKPVITKLETGFMNKFGGSPLYARKIRKDIDGVPVSELVERYGSPLFVISERKLRERYRKIYNAFSSRYPNVQFGWSYKTNYLKAVCSVLHQEGAIAEVVSAFEYEKARNLGIDGKNIIFNGPHKTLDILEKAASEGAMIHIDHFDEIIDLEKIADRLGKKIKVAIRVNMDTGIHPQWDRFGFNLETGQALDAVKRIATGGKLVLNGLHSHIGTFILEPEAYGKEVEKLVKLAYEIEDNFGFKIEYLDIGGGFPSKNKLKGTYLPPDVLVPSVEEYAEKITEALYSNLRPGDFPKLILETGRAIIDEAEYLITTIFASKRLPDGRKAYIADAGVNILFTAFWYKFNIEIDREVQGTNEPSVIYGPLCMNIDVIDDGTMLPPLERGTRLIISPVGAYNNTQWMQFIEYRPNVVMIMEDGSVEIVREREDISDIERRERLPEKLRINQ